MTLLERMSVALNLPVSYLNKMARTASHCYKTYTISKRSGGRRTIHHPSRELKALQRWLLFNVIEQWPVHEAATAYRRGFGIKDNAARHVESRYLLRMDLSDFFPSLTSSDIRNYIALNRATLSDWDTLDTDFLVRIVCRYDTLTIGSPTSPALSNALCFNLDAQLEVLANQEQLTYTRYADDLFFSTTHPNVLWGFPDKVEETIQALKLPSGLRINHSKTRHSSKRGRRRVTGITLGSDGTISVGRSIKRFIRRQVYRYNILSREEKAELAGLIAFAQDIDRDIINSLILKYGLELIEKARCAE